MSQPSTETLSVVTERDMPFPPEKVWRALTQPQLIEEWLMKNDFEPSVGRRFTLRGDWGSVDCEVLTLEPNRSLSYSWTAMGLGTLVTMTLSPSGAGTHLRVEQSGFSPAPDAQRYYMGAKMGWQGFIAKLAEVVAKLD